MNQTGDENRNEASMSFAQEIVCPRCDSRLPLNQLVNLCVCGSPLLVRYDLKKAAAAPSVRSLHTLRLFCSIDAIFVESLPQPAFTLS